MNNTDRKLAFIVNYCELLGPIHTLWNYRKNKVAFEIIVLDICDKSMPIRKLMMFKVNESICPLESRYRGKLPKTVKLNFW